MLKAKIEFLLYDRFYVRYKGYRETNLGTCPWGDPSVEGEMDTTHLMKIQHERGAAQSE